MRYYLSLSFFLLTSLVYATYYPTDIVDSPEDFALVKAEIGRQLDFAHTNLAQMVYEIHWTESQMSQEYGHWMSNNYDDYDRGGRDAARNFYDLWTGYYGTTSAKLESGLQHISSSQALLSQINYVAGSGSDYSNVLDHIATNTLFISHDTQNITNSLATIISNLFYISVQCEGVFTNLNAFLETILPDLNDCWANFVEFMEYATDVEDTFIGFFDLAYDRLDKPSGNMKIALADAWRQTHAHLDQILLGASNHTYYTSTPLESLQTRLNNKSLHLSNEGWILAESLQAQTWTYLVDAEILKKVSYIADNLDLTNSVISVDDLQSLVTNVHMIMEHQTICQEPYFQLFNRTVFGVDVSDRMNPYGATYWKPLTNFVLTAQHGNRSQISFARQAYKNVESNWFNRIETQLLLLNGLIPLNQADTEDYEKSNLDKENVDRWIRYATNGVYEVVGTVSSLSNGLTRVFSEFKGLLDSFSLPAGHGDGYLLMIPEVSIGGISLDMPSLSWSDISELADPVRITTTLLWYFVFGFLSFRLVLLAVYLFGRTVAHIVLIVSTLMH